MVGKTPAERSSMRMPFGKHQGKLVADVPTSYLVWVVNECQNVRQGLRRAIESELEQRDWQSRGTPPPRTPGTSTGDVLPATIIRTWFREMSLRFHPDRGGATGAMKAINHAHERLKELSGV